jgi:hypothetical protein
MNQICDPIYDRAGEIKSIAHDMSVRLKVLREMEQAVKSNKNMELFIHDQILEIEKDVRHLTIELMALKIVNDRQEGNSTR